ncbi:uncharacterized protein LOC143896040 [Temnothorax americanus]|uniref:uncharacterized protein LOC143896040 n=1 Tax=Temnothorax americanus TaxID=1964332 RepID=UPI004067D9E0
MAKGQLYTWQTARRANLPPTRGLRTQERPLLWKRKLCFTSALGTKRGIAANKESSPRTKNAQASGDQNQIVDRLKGRIGVDPQTPNQMDHLRGQQSYGSPAGAPGCWPALTAQELEDAQWAWIRVTQAAWHAEELRILSRRKSLPRRSQLLCLSPILDEDRILRVGGRLKHAILSHDERHPAILPRDLRLTTLIVEAFHKKTLHGGVQLTLAMIRQKFWIPKGRALVQQCIHRCIPCVRWRAASPVPLMGSLPSPMVTISRAFAHTGVDYAGPILLRTSRGRGHKTYKGFIALFVCLCTKAVHLEAASDLTTDAFLAALRRFTAWQGLCAAIYSDRGTNFVGADKELRSFLRAAIMEDSYWKDSLASEGIAWRFNPPAAPHMGGLWEAAVKSVKHHLCRVIGDSTPN